LFAAELLSTNSDSHTKAEPSDIRISECNNSGLTDAGTNERKDVQEVYGKYKPVAIKVRPLKAELPAEFRITREIKGDPLKDMPVLPTNPPEFIPNERYTLERKEIIDKNHPEGFLWPEERKLMHSMMKQQEMGFAWETKEAGNFKPEFFPPVKMAVVPHVPWVERVYPYHLVNILKSVTLLKKRSQQELMNLVMQVTEADGFVY
jgi:hypothetical protein